MTIAHAYVSAKETQFHLTLTVVSWVHAAKITPDHGVMIIVMPRLTKVSGAYSVCRVRPSVCPFVRPTFCRHYSSKTVRRSILVFICVVPNILKLCTLLSVGPFIGPKLTFELRQFFTYYTPAEGGEYIVSRLSLRLIHLLYPRGRWGVYCFEIKSTPETEMTQQ